MNDAEQIAIVQGIENAPEAARLRERVFLEEQGFSTEFDEIDSSAWHLTLFRQGRALAVGRLYPDAGQPGLFIIGRVAADPDCRGQGLGRKAVLALEDKARRLGGRAIDLSAQTHAQGFYEKLGYAAYGEIYMDEHCPHIHMKKTLPGISQFEKDIVVEQYQCDLRDQLPMSGLLRQIQQISTDHCDSLGIDAQRYRDTNTAFLLAKVSVECLEPIPAGARLRIVTRPSQPVRATYHRFTSILDERGREVCTADARWILIDTQQRRILRQPPEALGLPFTAPVERTHDIAIPKPAQLEPAGDFTASYSRTDRNGHLNNTFYADVVCDALPLEQIARRPLRRMTLHYHKELRLGQTMTLSRARLDENSWYVCGMLPEGKCFEAKAVFAD